MGSKKSLLPEWMRKNSLYYIVLGIGLLVATFRHPSYLVIGVIVAVAYKGIVILTSPKAKKLMRSKYVQALWLLVFLWTVWNRTPVERKVQLGPNIAEVRIERGHYRLDATTNVFSGWARDSNGQFQYWVENDKVATIFQNKNIEGGGRYAADISYSKKSWSMSVILKTRFRQEQMCTINGDYNEALVIKGLETICDPRKR